MFDKPEFPDFYGFISHFPNLIEFPKDFQRTSLADPSNGSWQMVPRKGKSTIMEIMKLTIKDDFRRGTVFSCFSYHKITLFENKYGIKLITLISMYHLNLL